MQVGDLATWVGAVGTVGALVFTAYTLRRQIDRERRADDEHRRMYAKRVRVSITQGPISIAEVNNDGDANIYRVGVYLVDQQTQALIARSSTLVDIIAPGTQQSFPLVPVTQGAKLPSSIYCFAQFTDDNGYRWSRYVMGLLSETAREEGISRKRAEALLVSLSGVGEPPSAVEVSNDGERSIHQVSVLVRDKSDGRLTAASDTTQEAIAPGITHRFRIMPTGQGSSTPADYFCIAQFTDSYGLLWNRYLMGRLDKISPDPPLDGSNTNYKLLRKWLRALRRRWRRLIRRTSQMLSALRTRHRNMTTQ
jgi:hypothetical protein